jgi:hypothetical protein
MPLLHYGPTSWWSACPKMWGSMQLHCPPHTPDNVLLFAFSALSDSTTSLTLFETILSITVQCLCSRTRKVRTRQRWEGVGVMRDKEQKLENVETSHTLGEASCTTRYIDLTEIAIVRVGFVKDKSQNVETKVSTFLCAVAHKSGDQRHRRTQSVLTRRHPHPTR